MDEGQILHSPAPPGPWRVLWRGILRRPQDIIGRDRRPNVGDSTSNAGRLGAPSPRAAAEAPLALGDAEIVVRALGGTDVWVRGTPVTTWVSQRGLMVLRYLVLHPGRPVAREKLMDLLWPESSARSARNNLNVAIYGLRRSLEVGGSGPYITHADGAYGFACSVSISSDVAEFEALVRDANGLRQAGHLDAAVEAYQRAATLYRGPLFDDATTGEWYLLDRRLLEERYVDAMDQLATHAYRAGEIRRAIELCHAMLRIDQCHETAHRLLMRAYAASDQYHLAARQYADCVTTLHDELDVAPHPETTAIFRSLGQRRH